MQSHFGKFALILMTGSLALGGCATTGSVKRAHARADEAFEQGQKGQADAARAQGSADGAMTSAQRAQASADAAGTAAQSAGAAAQAASVQAQGTGEQVATLNGRIHKLEVAEWRRKHPAKRHHHGHHKPKTVKKSTTDQVSFHK